MNDLAFDLLRLLAQRDPATTVVVSPASIRAALVLLSVGAGGETQREIRAVAGQSAPQALQRLRQPGSTTQYNPKQSVVAFASCLWSPPHLRFSRQFIREAERDFAAEAMTSEAPAAPTLLNDWIKKTTHGLIPSILDIPPDPTGIVLANGVVFLGKWTVPFDPSLTAPGSFQAASGPPQSVPMMTRAGRFRYAAVADGQLIDLPYDDGHYSFRIFLPGEKQRVERWLASVTILSWAALGDGLHETSGEVTMPRMSLAFSSELKPELRILGIRAAFLSGSADFAPMMMEKTPLFVSSIMHRTMVKVDEAGTKAAAATSIQMEGATTPKAAFRMLVDRPFVFAIHESSSDELLFLGLVRML